MSHSGPHCADQLGAEPLRHRRPVSVLSSCVEGRPVAAGDLPSRCFCGAVAAGGPPKVHGSACFSSCGFSRRKSRRFAVWSPQSPFLSINGPTRTSLSSPPWQTPPRRCSAKGSRNSPTRKRVSWSFCLARLPLAHWTLFAPRRTSPATRTLSSTLRRTGGSCRFLGDRTSARSSLRARLRVVCLAVSFRFCCRPRAAEIRDGSRPPLADSGCDRCAHGHGNAT